MNVITEFPCASHAAKQPSDNIFKDLLTPPDGQEETSRAGTESILLAEDQAAMGQILEIVLQQHGYKVTVARSGREAMQLWEKAGTGFDLLLTDVMMPDGMTGIELAAVLKSRHPKLKVLLTTAYDPDSLVKQFGADLEDPVLQKPYQIDDLLFAVRDTLDW
jgi:two-component system, cell cycle sensor histidine kinase and response regulator CckA